MIEKIGITFAAILTFLAAICFIIQPFTTCDFSVLVLIFEWLGATLLIFLGVELIKISRQ